MGEDQSQRIAGRYELTQAISTGGMGQVWRGYDTILDRDIAVKLIRPDLVGAGDRDELIGRFRREARVTARIEHPGVPAVHDAAFDPRADRLFLVMQLVHGVSLADVIAERGALPAGWAVAIAAQVCAVLSHAHVVPVVHRDLKPGNIMIATDGTVKVLDFGVAAVLRSDATRLTSTGRIVGTKPYMSPEQIRNTPVTPRTDLYALGCVLHELLAGQRVFDGDTEVALMYQHLEQEPTPLRQLRPDVPADLDQLVRDLLAKNPDDRPPNAWTVHDRLTPHLPASAGTAEDTAPPPGALPDPTRPYRRPMAPRLRPTPAPSTGRSVTPTPEDAVGAPGPVLPVVSDEEITAALDRAEYLIDNGRFTQAADGLAEFIDRATAGRPTDGPVLDLRRTHAAALLLGGDTRAALPRFDALAEAFTRIAGPDDDETLECRRQAAYCRIDIGHTGEALAQLHAVHAAYQRRGHDLDEDVLELRCTVAKLHVAVGDQGSASAALPDLYRDVLRTLGAGHPLAAEISDLLARLDPPDGAST